MPVNCPVISQFIKTIHLSHIGSLNNRILFYLKRPDRCHGKNCPPGKSDPGKKWSPNPESRFTRTFRPLHLLFPLFSGRLFLGQGTISPGRYFPATLFSGGTYSRGTWTA